jgi:WD40 repeat protein
MHHQSPDNSEKRNQGTLKMLRRAIAFSGGEFSLILVRCNYQLLRDRFLEKLREFKELEIRTISLMPSTQTLYQTIGSGLGETMPDALMVFGLELLENIDALVTATNQVRDEFRKNFPFVVVLWVNDQVLKVLIQKAPDFHSWATTSEVLLSHDELIALLQKMSDRVLAAALEDGSMQFRSNQELLGDRYRWELDAACKDLRSAQVTLPPRLNAYIEFILGRDDYASDRLNEALDHYQASLNCWSSEFTALGEEPKEERENRKILPSLFSPLLPISDWAASDWVNVGLVRFYRGLCFCRQADRQQTKRQEYLIQARRELEKCKEAFEESGQPDLSAKFLGQLGLVFQRLSDWSALEQQAKQLLKLEGVKHHPDLLAQNYGFLAQVALQKQQWKKAESWAKKALEIITKSEQFIRVRGLYVLLLARAQAQLGQRDAAIANLIDNLKIARTDPDYDPQVYLDTLKELRLLYFEQEDYPGAFQLKQEQRAIEAQLGLRAFIGAGRLHSQRHSLNPTISQISLNTTVAEEIKASGRQQDVNNLISRLGRNDYKLTVIHGPSGVGKSSLVQAGLVPQLRQQAIDARTPLPLVVEVYTDWLNSLEVSLNRELQGLGISRGDRRHGIAPTANTDETETFAQKRGRILAELQKNADRNLLTVLIFDQFEEFFFFRKTIQEKYQFYEFLRDCLQLPFVKAIVSLREDSLYYLLEGDRLCPVESFDGDILNKNIRYYLGNFTKKNAYNVIHSLTERSQIQLAPELLDRLVDDLADQLGEVRPIELQVVGAQLQAQNIRTLEEYQEYGPKEKLVERFLEETIADCGPKNQRAARLLLYFLTEENNIRPLKTLAELGSELVASGVKVKQLESILEILEKSGLLFKLPEVATNRYQLVHDYLVTFIRQQPEIQQELRDLQKKYQKLAQEKELSDELALVKEKEKKHLQFTRNLTAVGLMIFVCLSAIAWHQAQITKQAEQKANISAQKAETAAVAANEARQRAQIAEIEATNAATKALLLSNNQLEALISGVKAATKIQSLNTPNTPPSDIQAETINQLYKTVHQTSEINRLQSHRDSVVTVSFSPKGDFLVSGSIDNTVKIWHPKGTLLRTIFAHDRPITRVAVSPDGKLIASASVDQTVKIWQTDGNQTATLQGHTGGVTGVSFAPNGDLIATSSQDKTIKLWQPDGTLVRTLTGHDQAVTSVTFSPTGRMLASTSVDNTVKLWNDQGILLKTLRGHTEAVTSVSFSPDGQQIATASGDRTVKLWKADGTLWKTLSGHRDRVLGVSFSPDGKILASAGADFTVILWKSDGTKIRELGGHRGDVRSVSFSPHSQILASASSDNTVKLWKTFASGELPTLKAHNQPVLAVSYSPDGQILASASEDRTVKLWSAKGRQITSLIGHQGAVWDVSFSPDSQLIATASGDKTVRLWAIGDSPKENQGKGKILGEHSARVLAVSFSPNGKTIASASEDGMIHFWDLNGKKLQSISGHSSAINRISFSPNGDRFATASSDRTVKIWQADGTLQTTLHDHKGEVWNATFSPTGDRLATASSDNTIKLWDPEGNLLKTLEGHLGSVYWVSFSRDGQLIASASKDQTVKLWDAAGNLLTTLEGHPGQVLSLSFSPDGNTIASAAQNQVILWNLSLDQLLSEGCSWLKDYLTSHQNNLPRDRNLCQNQG